MNYPAEKPKNLDQIRQNRPTSAESGLDSEGFKIEREYLSREEQASLAALLGPINSAGRRGVLAIPAISAFAESTRALKLLTPYLVGKPFPIRAIYFDKSAVANWSVAWHQDLMIAVRRKIDLPGFGPWRRKDLRVHVSPPVEILQQMLTVRFHFDLADDTTGALKVIAGSHRFGKLSADQIASFRAEERQVTCVANAGDALLMRPLLLHASSKNTTSCRRRILHIEYACSPLSGGLEWEPH